MSRSLSVTRISEMFETDVARAFSIVLAHGLKDHESIFNNAIIYED
jgi:hypothetical protein